MSSKFDNDNLCVACGNHGRRTTEVSRGLCPLCLANIARENDMSARQLLATSEPEFARIVAKYNGLAQALEKLQAERQIDPAKAKALVAEGKLVTIKTAYEAAKAAGYGGSALVRATGGDTLRSYPLGYQSGDLTFTPLYAGKNQQRFLDSAVVKPENLAKLATLKVKKVAKSSAKAKAMKVAESNPEPQPAKSAVKVQSQPAQSGKRK